MNPPRIRVVLGALVLSFVGSCSGIQSSVVRTGQGAAPYKGRVVLLAFAPTNGKELGLVQVSGPRAVDELAPEFSQRVAELGGDTGVVDKVSSKFENATHSETYSYKCGKSTCTGTRWVTSEVMTVQMVGRAYERRAGQ
jgi:hypothetical protein